MKNPPTRFPFDTERNQKIMNVYDLHISDHHIDHLLDALSAHLVAVSHDHDDEQEAVAADLLRRAELLAAYISAADDAAEAMAAYRKYCTMGDAPDDDEGNDDTTDDDGDSGVHYYTSSPRLKMDGIVPPDAKQDTKEEIIARCPPEARDALKAWLNREWEQKEAPSSTAKAIPRPF